MDQELSLETLRTLVLDRLIPYDRIDDAMTYVTDALGGPEKLSMSYASTPKKDVISVAGRSQAVLRGLELVINMTRHSEGFASVAVTGRSEYDANEVPAIGNLQFFLTPGYDLEELDAKDVALIQDVQRAFRGYVSSAEGLLTPEDHRLIL